MATNWKLAEAVKAIRANDVEAIKDIGKRFPLFAVNAAGGVEGLLRILEAAPEYLTARKIETVLRGGDGAEEDDEDNKEEDEKPVKQAKKAGRPPKAETKDDEDNKEEDEKVAKVYTKKELMKMKPAALKEIASELGVDLKAKKFKRLEGDEMRDATVEAILEEQEPEEKEETKGKESKKTAKDEKRGKSKKDKDEDDDDDWDV